MDTNNQNSIWVNNPQLKTLLLVLIFVFLASGLGLAIFAQVQKQYRQNLYDQTEAALPKHQVKNSPASPSSSNPTLSEEPIKWQQIGNTVKFSSGFNHPSFTLPKGWFWSDLKLEDGYPGTKVFSAIASNYPNAQNYDKGNHPKNFQWFALSIGPAGNALKNAGIQQYADKQTDFTIKNGKATLYEILKQKQGTEDMVLPVYSGLAVSDGYAFNNNFELVLQHGSDGFPVASLELKNAMLALLKTVSFQLDWKTYRDPAYNFEMQMVSEWQPQIQNKEQFLKSNSDAAGSNFTSGTPIPSEYLNFLSFVLIIYPQDEYLKDDINKNNYSKLKQLEENFDSFAEDKNLNNQGTETGGPFYRNVLKTKIGGQAALDIRSTGNGGPERKIIFEKDNNIYEFSNYQEYFKWDNALKKMQALSAAQVSPIFQKVLGSFKFIDTADVTTWKTYKNEKYGFEFSYPKDLSFDIKSTNDFGLIISGNYTNLDDWLKSAKKYDASTGQVSIYTPMIIGGIPAVSVHDSDQLTKADEVFFIKDSKLYDFVFKTVDQKTSDQILSTFKFTPTP